MFCVGFVVFVIVFGTDGCLINARVGEKRDYLFFVDFVFYSCLIICLLVNVSFLSF